MVKEILTPKRAQEIQNEIFYNMPFNKKMKLFFKINNTVLRKTMSNVKVLYGNIDPVLRTLELHEHTRENREYYDKLFNKLIARELKK